MNTIINLTSHYATQEQAAEGVINPCEQIRKVIIDLNTYTECPTITEIFVRVRDLTTIAQRLCKDNNTDLVMIGGALWMMGPLTESLKRVGIAPRFAYSKRVSQDIPQADGSVKKVVVFKHDGWVIP